MTTPGRVLTPSTGRGLAPDMPAKEIQFILARAWLATSAEEYGVTYRLNDSEVRIWKQDATYPLYVYLDDNGEWVLNTGPRFHYLHRAVLFMLTDAQNALAGAAWHLSTLGEPCWKGCPC